MLRWVFLASLLLPFTAHAQPIPAPSSGFAQGYVIGNVAAATTNFTGPGGGSANQNGGVIASKTLTLSNLYIRVAVAPATAQSDVITVYAGPTGSMSATSLTCTIAAAATTCNDTTDVVTVQQGQSWAVQVVTGATNATGVSQVGILVN